MRHDLKQYEVVCIHRRGIWDLPKGKQDDGETVQECALREVREELGIDDVQLIGPAGRTLHGYARRRSYHVKTTLWYWMKSGAVTFRPQVEEQIDGVEWVPWGEAVTRVGYDTLKTLLQKVDPAAAGI